MLRPALVAFALLVATPAFASPSAERTVHWAAERVFPTAVRFLRVDEHASIVDKDASAGYVVFDLQDDGKTYHGALEVVTVTDDPPEVKLELRIEDRPSYMAESMLDRLEQKLHDELGDPPEPPPKPDPAPAPPPPPPPSPGPPMGPAPRPTP